MHTLWHRALGANAERAMLYIPVHAPYIKWQCPPVHMLELCSHIYDISCSPCVLLVCRPPALCWLLARASCRRLDGGSRLHTAIQNKLCPPEPSLAAAALSAPCTILVRLRSLVRESFVGIEGICDNMLIVQKPSCNISRALRVGLPCVCASSITPAQQY